MAIKRPPRPDEVLATVRRQIAESRYAYAPGCTSAAAVYAALCIERFPRGGATRAAVEAALGELVEGGALAPVEVVGPSGERDGGWFGLGEPSG